LPAQSATSSRSSSKLEAAGAHFRSLHDRSDTTTPQGMFSLQVLDAVTQLERALIAERTKPGWGLRAAVVIRASHDAAHLDSVLCSATIKMDGVHLTPF
jgi:hypothetical protein